MTALTFVEGALSAATKLAAGATPLVGSSSARAACLLARQALEQVIDDLLAVRDLGCPDATVRCRLIALSQAYTDQPDLTYRAAIAWWRLSSACHHHAYELDPTAAEAISVVSDVCWLAATSKRLAEAS